MDDILKLVRERIVCADGGMGTQLQIKGLQPGDVPEDWNISRPDDIRAVHESYFAAGADFVLANTFGANPAKYHGAYALEDVITAGVRIAKEAASKRGFAALDVGPTGRLLEPAGDCPFDEAYEAFAKQIRIGAAAGADLVMIETMGDTRELKAAVLAAKENCSLPVFATVALGEDGKLLTGAAVECVAALLEGLRVDVLGFNCGLGPDLMLPYVKRLLAATRLPVMVKPNAGLPKVVDGETVFPTSPETFAREVAELVEAGVRVTGGCCGTTPAHIKSMNDAVRKLHLPPTIAKRASRTVVSSGTRVVELPYADSVVIGERINPTGKKKLKEAYKAGDTGYILREAIAQAEAGAHILDVNAGVPGIDEPQVLRDTVEAIQSVCDLPLQIDTSDPFALDRAMRVYNGKALVNSVNGKEEVMDAVFPLVAKYGGVVVGLTLDENGIPPTADGRVAIAKKILARGAEYGLEKDDFIIDVLCLAVSADANSVNTILESLQRVHDELGCRTVLGVSNVSFGLPARPLLNATFYTLALQAGLTSAIVNPLSADMMAAYHAWRALTARDAQCGSWIGFAANLAESSRMVATGGGTANAQGQAAARADSLKGFVQKGLKQDAAAEAQKLLDGGRTPVEVIDGEIVPALEVVGKGFEKGSVFLPQLLMAAEAAAAAFDVIRAALAKAGNAAAPKGPIIVATVKGDIHDIGKNIVRALLENYGFKVIDLGRDVPPETVVERALAEGCKLVGLSALMTTTVGYMAETIKQLNAADPAIKTFVGGAVLTEDYAKEINATWYAKDAMASVRIAEEFFK
ncbi:MAG: homocysteine S-methyltransferase family protein [Kiritimatiellae bacterium]|nr:homocysteine S-methyltransferase family protein [Kiritimatiellia bacterium]